MNTLKKLRSICVACFTLVFVAASITGCDQNNQNDPTPSSSSASSQASVDLDPDNTIVWQVYDDSYAAIWQTQINALLKEKGASYTVKIEAYQSMFGESKEETASELLAELKQAGKQADVLSLPATSRYWVPIEGTDEFTYAYQSPYTEAIAAGLLDPLDGYLDSAQGKQIVEAVHPVDLKRAAVDGKVYGISQHLRQVSAVYYNKEYLEKYNIDPASLSADLFKNEEVLRQVWEGEGKQLPVYVHDESAPTTLGMWSVSPCQPLGYDADTGEFVSLFDTERCYEFYKKLYALKDKGLAQHRADGFDDFFAVGGTAHTDEVYETTYTFVDTNKNEVQKEVVAVPNLQIPTVNPNWGDSANGIASWSENKEDALDFLTRLYTDPDLANLVQYGVEGDTYQLEDGKARYTDQKLSIFGENFTNPLITYPQDSTGQGKRDFLDRYYAACESNLPDGFRFDIQPVLDQVDALNKVYESEAVVSLIFLQSEDFDGAFQSIRSLLTQAGMEEVKQEAQRQLEVWGHEG